jgi:hypothetical protein
LAHNHGGAPLDSRLQTYGTVLGVWLVMVPFALVNDHIIVTVSPEHFTLHHEPLFGLTDARSLATAYAFAATLLPGIGLGLTMVLVYRVGPRPPLSYRRLFVDAAIIIGLAEVIAWTAGAWVWIGGSTPYPAAWFPDTAPGTVITQTVQVTLYFACAVVSSAMAIRAALGRSRRSAAETVVIDPSVNA